MPRRQLAASLRAAALAVTALALSTPDAAAQTFDLIAAPMTKSVSLPDGTSVAVPMWGFGLDANGDGDLLDVGDLPASVPGPRITVPPGTTTLTINLRNALTGPGAEDVSLVVPGQMLFNGAPDIRGGRIFSMTPVAPPGGSHSYQFGTAAAPLKPGTFLYQSGAHQAVQVQMGLYGAVTMGATAGEAYPGVAYANEVLLLYSEIDIALHQAVSTGTYGDATAGGPTSTIDYAPALFLVNGESYTGASLPIPGGTAGQRTLIRMLNAGLKNHVVVVDNASMSVMAEDGNPYRDFRAQAAVLLPAGKTHDAIWTPTAEGDYSVYDRTLHLVAGGYPLAGMLATLRVGAGVGSPPPAVQALGDIYPLSGDPLLQEDLGSVLFSRSVLANDDPPMGLTAELFSHPSAGTVTLNPDGKFTYVPPPNFSGVDSFSYRAVSGGTRSAPAEVLLMVTPAQDAPTAFPLTLGVASGETKPITLSGLDPDGDPLTFHVTQLPLPAEGTLSIIDPVTSALRALVAGDLNTTSIPAGTVFYTANATGPSTFMFRAADGFGVFTPASTAAVAITVHAAEDLTAAAGTPIILNVVGSDGASIADYYWTLEEDLTYDVVPGELDPRMRTGRDTLSVSFHRSYMPVMAAGDESAPPLVDSTKRYFVSVLPKNGTHTNGGARIASGQTSVQVFVNKTPIPTGMLRVQVFLDNGSLNGVYNNVEPGLEGFAVMLEDTAAVAQRGHQAAHQITDAFGNPLGTTYQACTDPAGCTSYEVGQMGQGFLLTDANGYVTFENLAPGLYEVFVIPPPGSNYVQGIQTVEGGKPIEAWVKANEPAYFHEFGPPGPHVIIGFVELTNNRDFLGAASTGPHSTITGNVTNVHMSRPPAVALFSGAPFDFTRPYVALQYGAGEYGQVVYLQPTDEEGNFEIEGVPSGTYKLWVFDSAANFIPGAKTITVNAPTPLNLGDVPKFQWFTRSYQYVFEDTNQNGFRDAGERGIPEQATNLRFRDGTVYKSFPTDVNGFVPYEEIFPWFNWLIAEVDYTRFKATGATVVVDAGGDPKAPSNAGWPELVGAELDSRILVPQPQSENGGAPFRTETGPVLLEAWQSFLGQSNVILWGKAPYAVPDSVAPDVNVGINLENDTFPGPDDTDGNNNGQFDVDVYHGGISGIVHYSSTRAENLARWGTGEPWEPGIAGVRVQLWNETRTRLLNEVTTDSWDDSLPTGCQGEVYMYLGRPTDCYDGMRNWNQIRPGVFDGGFAFYTQKEPFVTNAGTPTEAIVPIDQRTTERPLPAGKYIVKVIAPPGYKHVKEEDKNVDFGEQYIPQEFLLTGYPLGDEAPPDPAARPSQDNDNLITPFCVGALHTVPPELSLFPGVPTTYDGDEIPLCDEKLIVLRNGQNATGSFFLFTEAPIAGKLMGMVLDDTANEFDPNAPQFGEKFALAWMPVAIKDFTGREITRTMTDRNGIYNAMVPSTFTADRPAPDGYAPAMLQACVNPPLMPGAGGAFVPDPLHNKRYSTWCFPFQYMPGTTTYMDTPVVPTGAFAGQPGLLTLDAELPNLTPVIHSVNGALGIGPYVVLGTGAPGRLITLTSAGAVRVPNPEFDWVTTTIPKEITRDYGFGPFAGEVLLDGDPTTIVSWSDTQIQARLDVGSSTGQLTVLRCLVNADPCPLASQRRSVAGVTLTVASSGFHASRPPIVVAAGGSIQAVIDSPSTAPGDLVLVPPGVYEELVIMNKPVRLQGWGSRSTIISAVKSPTEKLEQWRDKVKAMLYANQPLPDPFQDDIDVAPLGDFPGPGDIDYNGNGVFDLVDLDVFGPTVGSYLLAYQFDELIASLLNDNRFDGLPDPNEVPKLGDALGDLPLEILAILFGSEGGGIHVFGQYRPEGGVACPVTARSAANPGFGRQMETGDLRPNARIDGFGITGSDGAAGIEVNAYACDIQITNNYIYNNHGYDAGGIKVGHIGVLAGQGDEPAHNDRVEISHNVVSQNGSVLAHPGGDYKGAGGIGIGSGAPGYKVTHNFVAGNFTGGNGAGIGHLGLSTGGTIDHNTVIFNETFNQAVTRSGGGIFVGGRAAAAGDSIPASVGDPRGFYLFPAHLPGPTPGSGHVTVSNNLIQGNQAASGDGGGLSLAQVNGRDVAPGVFQFVIDGAEVDDPLLVYVWNASEEIIAAAAAAAGAGWRGWQVNVFGNTIVNNTAGLAGAGIALQDAVDVRIIHNTIARNDSLAVAGEAFELRANLTDPFISTSQPAGIVARQHSLGLAALLGAGSGTFSNPQIVNSIVWQNRSFFFGPVPLPPCSATQPQPCGVQNPQDPNPAPQAYGLSPRGASPYWDLGVLGAGTSATLAPTYSVLTSTSAVNGGNGGSNNVTTAPSFVRTYFNGNRGQRLDLVEIESRILTPIAIDEGGNFIRPLFGPLTLTNPAGTLLGDYHVASGVNGRFLYGAGGIYPTLTAVPPSLTVDADGDPRVPRTVVTPHRGADQAGEGGGASPNNPPTGAPVLSQPLPQEGELLTVSQGTLADPNGLGSFSYQWQAQINGGVWANIAGATSSTFTPTEAQVHPTPQLLRAIVSFIDGGGTLEAVPSAASGVVGDLFVGTAAADNYIPSVSGSTAGRDNATGNGGNDILTTGDAADVVAGNGGNDTVNTGAGNDSILFDAAGGFDAVDGGAGVDEIRAVAAGAVIGLTSLTGVESITSAGFGNVSIIGSDAANTLNFSAVTLTGIDSIEGMGGNDVVTGSAGDDTISGDLGADTLNGGGGDDIIAGGADADTIAGGAGADYIDGGAAADTIDGGGGADTIDGGGGADSIAGGAGDDSINGEGGNDVITGGAGDDDLHPGATLGNDEFVFAAGFGADTIDGFGANQTATVGQDLLNVSALGITAANFGTRVTVVANGGNALITLRNAANVVVGTITLNGVAAATVTAGADFILAP